MKIKMSFIKVRCNSCGYAREDPEFLLKNGSGEYTIKCRECSSDLAYMKMENGYLKTIHDANRLNVTEIFKYQIEVIW
jgi:uncharacterized Zn finger protein